MMKVSSKRRRTKKQIEDEKEAEAAKAADMQAKLALFAQAEAKLADYDNMQASLAQAKAMMLELQSQGHVNIDEHGNVSPSKQRPRDDFQDFGNQ